jgi:hypothetical protein
MDIYSWLMGWVGIGVVSFRQGLRVGRDCLMAVQISKPVGGLESDDDVDTDIIGDGVKVAAGGISGS